MAGLNWLKGLIDVPLKIMLHDREAFNIKNSAGQTVFNVDTEKNRVTGAIQTYNGQMTMLNPEAINLSANVYKKIEGTWVDDEGVNFEIDPLNHKITYTGEATVDLLFLGTSGVRLTTADTLTFVLYKNDVRQDYIKTILDFTSASKNGHMGASAILRQVQQGDYFYVGAKTLSNNTLNINSFNISFITLGSATV